MPSRRHHDPEACYQAGYVLNGEMFLSATISGRCPGGPPSTRQWVAVDVQVRGIVVSVKVDGNFVRRRYRARHWPRGDVGTMALTGYNTTLWYKPEVVVGRQFRTGMPQEQCCPCHFQVGHGCCRVVFVCSVMSSNLCRCGLTSSKVFCGSPFSSHSVQISLNAALPSNHWSSSPPFLLPSTFWSSAILANYSSPKLSTCPAKHTQLICFISLISL